LLSPLRSVTIGFALGLFAMAGSIVGGLTSPWIDLLWWAMAAVSSVVALVLSYGAVSASARPARAVARYPVPDHERTPEGERHVDR